MFSSTERNYFWIIFKNSLDKISKYGCFPVTVATWGNSWKKFRSGNNYIGMKMVTEIRDLVQGYERLQKKCWEILRDIARYCYYLIIWIGFVWIIGISLRGCSCVNWIQTPGGKVETNDSLPKAEHAWAT